MNRQPPSISAGTNAAPSLAGAGAGAASASYSSSSSSSAASATSSNSSSSRKSKKKKKRLRPQKHISRWSEAFFGGGGDGERTNSQLDSIKEGFEEEESSSSSSSSRRRGSNVSKTHSDSDDTIHRSGHSSGGDHCSPAQRGKAGPLHACTRAHHDDTADCAGTKPSSSTRSLDYVSAAAVAGASAAGTPHMHNHASNATMPTAASTAYYEDELKDGEWIEPLPPDEGGTANTSSRRRLSGGGHRRSSNSSGSGRSTGDAAGDRGGGGKRRGSGSGRSRLRSIPDDIAIEVSDDNQMLQQQFQQSALTMRGALSASSGEESGDNNVTACIERRVAAALADGTHQQMVGSSAESAGGDGADIGTSSGDDAAAAASRTTAPTRQLSAINIATGAAALNTPASAPQNSTIDIALKASASTSDVPKPAHRSSSFTGSEPIKDANPKARSSSMPLVDDDDLDIESIMKQAAGASNAAAVGVGVGAAQTSSAMSAGLVPPMVGSLMTGRLNDSANSFGGGRFVRRTSDASNAESIAASSIAAASWMGSMGDSDLSGSSSDCEGDGPNRQRLRTRRRRKKSKRPTADRRTSNGSDDNGNGPTPMIVVEGASSIQSGRSRPRRTSWTRRPNQLRDSAPAGVAATYRDRRSSDPICRHEVARAIADLEADVSDLDGDSSSDDGNGYEKAPGSKLDAIVASLRAATANGGNNNNNSARRNTNQSPRDLHDLLRPNRVLRSTAPREPNSFVPSAAPFHASWPNQASAAMPRLDLNNQIAHVAASPSVEPTDTSNAAGAGAGIRRQDESFANVEDLIQASLRTQSSSLSLRSQQGGDIHGNERNAQSWPIVSSHRDDIASAAAVGVPVGARKSNNRSDSIIDTLQNLDLRQHLRDHDSASTFNFIDDDEGNNDATTTMAAGSQAGEGPLQTNPLMAERQAILGFDQERRRPGDSGHRISNSRSGVNSGPVTSNLPPRETAGPIRGLDALGAAIGAIAAAAPAVPPPNVSNSLISTSFSHRTSSMSTVTHRSSIVSAGGRDQINSAPAFVSSAGTANASASSSPPAATASAPTSARTANVRRRHSGPTRLYEAVASGSSYDTVKSLIDLDPSSTGHQNGAGLTPLHTAIERYDVPMSIIRLLLASNPSTASMPRTDGRTPMDLLWKRYVDPDSFRIQSSIMAANELATLMEMAVSDDGCNRPPSSQSGSEEDVDLEESSSRPGGLSKRDMDRKARAMRILLSSPRLRDFWDLMTMFVRASHHGTIADPLPSESGRWRIVHSCVATRCEPLMIRFAAALYPEQLRERDEQSGRIPLHITSALSCERSANSIDKTVLRLWPRGAWCHDNESRLAINLAIEAGKPWRFVRALLLCAPPSLLTRDTKTRMMPFMIAATSPDASLDCSYRLLRDSVDVITSALASNICDDDGGDVDGKRS